MANSHAAGNPVDTVDQAGDPGEPDTGDGHPAQTLRSVLVEYPDRPDRRTVCPRGLRRHELMVAWLTADADAFVELSERR